MAKEIKQKIVLEGEKEYNSAIKDAQRNLRTLRSELKAETAEMGKNATEQQKSAAKAKNLTEQIREQETIVQTLRDALEEVKDKYGDNADEVARWEQRLNNARATLGNMRSELDGVSDGMRGISMEAAAATEATKSVADSLESLGNFGSSISGAIEGIFSKMIDTVADAVGQLWDMIAQTAAKANNWTDIANYWGTNAQTIQQYARAVGASANSFEDLNSIVSKIVMGGKGKKIAELLGISDANYKTDWDYAMAVMNRMYEMSARGKDMTPIYEQIFGEKKSQSVMDLINDWGTIQEFLPQFSGENFGMSDEELSTMDELWVKINTIEQKWDALKSKVAAGFGQIAMDLLVNVEGTLEGLADYLNADSEEERQAALDKIRTNLEQFFTKLGEIVTECLKILNQIGKDLQESDDPVTKAIGDILVGLTDALQWMIDNQQAVKAAFETIFGVWLIAKLIAVGGKLASIIASIKTIQAFSLLGGGSSAGAAINGATGAGAGAAAGGAGIGAFLSNMLWSVGPIAAALGLGTIPAALMDKADKERRHSILEDTRASAAAAAELMGERGDAAKAAVMAASGAMDFTGAKNIFGQTIMGDQANVEDALAEVLRLNDEAGERFLSNRTALLMRYNGQNGMDAMSEYGLLDAAMQEAAEWLQTGEGPDEADTRDPVEILSDTLDAINGLADTEDQTGETMYKLIDTIIDNPALTALLSPEMLDRLGQYLDPNSGFGVGSPTRYTDAQQLLQELYREMDEAFWDRVGHQSGPGEEPQAIAGETAEAVGPRTGEPVPVEVIGPMEVQEKPGEEAMERPGDTELERPGHESGPGGGYVGIPGEVAVPAGKKKGEPVPYLPPEMITMPRPDDSVAMPASDEWEYLSNRTALLMRYNTIAGMTDMQQYELMQTAAREIEEQVGAALDTNADATEVLSDTLDAITELWDADEDPTGEAMYRLIDSIIDNPVITGKLSPDMLTRLGQYLDPQSGFGVGSPTRYTDAQQLLQELYREMDEAFWASTENGSTGGEVLNRLDELISVETEKRGEWHDPQSAVMRTLDADIWKNGGSGSGSDGLNGADLQRFLGLPAQISAAVRSGAATGVSGIRVTLDGYTVGRLVAPYVSQEIARDLP